MSFYKSFNVKITRKGLFRAKIEFLAEKLQSYFSFFKSLVGEDAKTSDHWRCVSYMEFFLLGVPIKGVYYNFTVRGI